MVGTALRGMRAGIIGVAREGMALARYLCHSGAQVVLTDLKPADKLGDAIQGIEDLPVRLALGGYPSDLLDTDVLFLSPGVPVDVPIVEEARRTGVPISSEPRLFVQLFTNPVVGITGSSGKTTTTTLVGKMLASAGLHAWVGGNIGRPLIGELSAGALADLAVMELSSFQLELFRPGVQGSRIEEKRTPASRAVSLEGWSPRIAVVTNITPNHLDRHHTMERYIQAKAAIVDYQSRDDWAVLNRDDAYARSFGERTPAGLVEFSLTGPVQQGGYLDEGQLKLAYGGSLNVICRSDQVRLRGEHNLANVLAAACAARIAGADIEAIRRVVLEFEGVPHRLEVVRRWKGITFVNDSIATTPERAIAAIRAFGEPLVLLAGGRDKHLPWDSWAKWVERRVRLVIGFGECAPLVGEAMAQGAPETAFLRCETLTEAIGLAARLAGEGEVVLFSPGGTSFDAYVDFEARGEAYRELVCSLGDSDA